MKAQIRNILLTTLVLSSLMSTTVFAAQTSMWRKVERIQINGDGRLYVRPIGLGTWGGTGCPNAHYVSIAPSDTEYQVVVNAIMASKLNSSYINFIGTCSADGNYLYIGYSMLL